MAVGIKTEIALNASPRYRLQKPTLREEFMRADRLAVLLRISGLDLLVIGADCR